MAKRLVSGIHESSAVHNHRLQPELRSHYDTPLIHGFLEPITHSRQDLGSRPKKCTHGGYPLEFPLVVKLPHVMSLHQSTPFLTSLNHLARCVSPQSSLIHQANHDGEFAPVYCVVLHSDCCSLRHAQDPTPPADEPRVFQGAVPSLYSRGTQSLGPNATLGSPDRSETGSRGPSPPYGW